MSENVPNNNNDNNKKKRILGRVFLSLGVVFCFLAGVFYFFKVSRITDSYVVELGDSVSAEASDYLYGKPFALNLAKVNLPKISADIPGEYVITVDYLLFTYYYYLEIIDSTAPSVEFSTDRFVCEVGAEVDALYFVSEVIDNCSILTYEYINIEDDEDVIISDDKYCFIATSVGVHNVVLKVTDYSGNYTTYYIPVICDTAPLILGVVEYFSSTEVFPNLLSQVYAVDERYGDIPVSYECSADNNSLPGDYKIKYTATNPVGLSSTCEGLLHVYEPLVLQDYLNTGKINNENGNVFGILNPYDSGYIEDSDIEKAVDLIKTSVIYIQYQNGNSYTNGSGFIVSIDSDYIIACTNYHVVKDMERVYVSFYDGITVSAEVVAGQRSPDVAFVRIPVSSLPGVTLSNIKTVHINLGYFNSLSNNPKFDMGMYCINADGSERVRRYGKIVRKSGMLAEYFAGYDYAVTEVSIPLTPGVSGSAIIDTHGNLLCMAAFYWEHDSSMEYYGVSVSDILDFYEKTFGERLEYY